MQECFRPRGTIIAFEAIKEDEIIYALEHKTIKSFSTLTCKTLTHISSEHLSSQTSAIAFSKEHSLVALANGKNIYILDTKTQMMIQTIISYSADVTVLHFARHTPYLIAGTDNGRVLQYRYDGKSTLSRLCSFPFNNPLGKKVIGKTYVGAIDSNSNYLAVSGYGGAITIIKLHSLTHKQTIQAARVRISVLKLISDELLVSAGIDENIYFHDLTKYKNIKNISSPIGKISQILPLEKTDYALLVGESHKIALLDLCAKKIISNNFISFDQDIRFVSLQGAQSIFVVLQDNSVVQQFLSNEEEFKELVQRNLLEKAFLLVEKNPLLKNTLTYDHLEELYSKIYTKALDAFLASHKTEAIALISPFSEIKSKKEDLELIFNSFEQYKKFHTLILQKKYHIAYSISENYPILQRTYQYTKLQQEFEKTFSFAQKQIKIGRIDVAEEILSIYMGVKSKRALVKLLLKQHKNYLIFLNSIKAKNYKNISLLIKSDPSFTQLPQYEEFLKTIDAQLFSIRETIYTQNIETAIEKIKKLQYFSHIKEDLKELYQLANDTQIFLEAYGQNNFLQCYKMLDKTKQLDHLDVAILLEKHWKKLMHQCELSALSGDLKAIKETLGELIILKSRAAKIGDLLRLSFQTKIRQLFAKRAFSKTETIFYSYIDIFGLDTEIKMLMKTFEKYSNSKLAITTNQELYKDRDEWLNSEFIVGNYKGV